MSEQGKNNFFACDMLLVYPAENIRLFEPMLPMGLSSIAAVLEQNDYSVEVVDLNIYKGDFKKALEKWIPKIIGISGTTPTRKASFQIASICKQVLADTIIVYGGPHASFTPKDTLTNIPHIDYVVCGEGEITMLSLCEYFIRNKNIDIKTLPGLCFRSNDDIIINKQKRIDDLNILPIVNRGFDYKIKMDFLDLEADYIVTSRGCPYRCNFCSASSMFPGGVRCRSAWHIKKEIDYILENKSIKALKLFDSTFTANRQHVLSFCEMIKPYKLLWECEARVDSVDKELLEIMKDAGCYYIDIGLETTNPNLIKQTAKNISVEQVEKVLQWCFEINIKTKLFLIFGLLDQNLLDCKRDVAFLKKYKNEISLFGTTIGLRVYPGTMLERELFSRKVLPQNFSWARYKNSKRNLLLFETSDTMLLEQKQLSHYKLLYVLLLLIFNKTLLSKENIFSLLLRNAKIIFFAFIAKLNRRIIKRLS